MSKAMEALAKRLFDALETADVATLKELYADDAVLWTNTLQRPMSAADMSAFLPRMAKRFAARRYENRRLHVFPGGFAHRHRLTCVRMDGAHTAAEICALVYVEDGKVVRIEEYLDAQQLAAIS